MDSAIEESLELLGAAALLTAGLSYFFNTSETKPNGDQTSHIGTDNPPA